MKYNDFTTNISNQRNTGGFIVKVRFKRSETLVQTLCVICVLSLLIDFVQCNNRPPRFLIDGQTEIVLRLKEGDESPVGKLCVYVCS